MKKAILLSLRIWSITAICIAIYSNFYILREDASGNLEYYFFISSFPFFASLPVVPILSIALLITKLFWNKTLYLNYTFQITLIFLSIGYGLIMAWLFESIINETDIIIAHYIFYIFLLFTAVLISIYINRKFLAAYHFPFRKFFYIK
ncbi:MAG: hypothetical protein WCO37_12540 [Bacteroidota bacterium]|jgi:hypothetical protein